MTAPISYPPIRGLKAFARVYAGWAYSQTFRERLHRKLGFETFEDLLVDWESHNLNWDANDLLAMLWSWQKADISANEYYGGDFAWALGISARAILIPCSDDLYFPPEDNAIEVRHMRQAGVEDFPLALGSLRRQSACGACLRFVFSTMPSTT